MHLPLGWAKCKVKPGIHHDSFLTGERRQIERNDPNAEPMFEVVHECRKCGAQCRWVELPHDREEAERGE